VTADLFGEAVPIPGLRVVPDIVSRVEEAELVTRIGEVPLTPFQFHGHEGKRLTHSFGWRYDFADQSFREAEPIPGWLLPLRQQAADVASLQADELIHVLLIRYDPGAGIGWHKDRPVFEQVVGISLGAATEMSFRQRTGSRQFRRIKLPLQPRSAYLLSEEVRHGWEHGIAEHDLLRFSITFRSLSELGRERAGLR
jgi:alkylated DNA repair dioxygenase AlkB